MEPTILSLDDQIGSDGMSEKPTPTHYLEKTMNEAFIGSSTTETFDLEKHDGLPFDSGVQSIMLKKYLYNHYPTRVISELQMDNDYRLMDYAQ